MNYGVTINKILTDKSMITSLNCYKSKSYKDVLYSQILVIPNEINAGNISNNTNYKAVLWNATEETKNLSNINEIGTSGIFLNGKPQAILDANTYLNYDIEITTQGDSFINADYNFIFSTGENLNLHINGSRVVLFGFDINWRTLPKESYSHYTDVRISYDGTEYRHNLTENPRMMLEYYYTLTDKERRILDGMLYSWADKLFLVPIFSQLTKTKFDVNKGENVADIDLTFSDIQKNMSLLFRNLKGDNIEIMNVERIENGKVYFSNSFTKNWKKETYVIPLCQAYINSESKTSHQIQNLTEILATFTVKDNTINTINNNIDNFETYAGLKLLTDEPNRKITIERAYARLVDTIDYGSGVRERISKDKKPAIVFNYQFNCIGKQEINNLKAFFNNMRGMTDEFLVSSFTSDIKLEKNILPSDTTLIIENSGVGTYYFNNEQKDLIIFYLSDGRKIIRKILNVLYNDENTERLIINEPFHEALKTNQICSIQFLSNARFNSDTIEFEFETDEYAIANTEIRILRG